ncbi:MAG: hypothetical protein QG668_13, partial [Patescibacteria group bacterium]|nr:hypothetical protein [Patescibacteria group bacterium]
MGRGHRAPARRALHPALGDALTAGTALRAAAGALGEGCQRRRPVKGLGVGVIRPRAEDLGVVEDQPR